MSEKGTIGLLVITGIVLSVGQMMLSRDEITVRVAIGRAIVSGGLGAAAGAFLAMFPELPETALVGIACVLVSLGTSALERTLRRLTRSDSSEWYRDPYSADDDYIAQRNKEIERESD